jgi:photosystem I subunit II
MAPMRSPYAREFRVFPSGKVEYLHPKDGVYPEKVNAGRVGVNQNMRSIGENVNPIKVRLRVAD